MNRQECVNCADEVLTLSSRGWCDGCEELEAWSRYESECDCDTCVREILDAAQE